jgi:hypothetical protein
MAQHVRCRIVLGCCLSLAFVVEGPVRADCTSEATWTLPALIYALELSIIGDGVPHNRR